MRADKEQFDEKLKEILREVGNRGVDTRDFLVKFDAFLKELGNWHKENKDKDGVNIPAGDAVRQLNGLVIKFFGDETERELALKLINVAAEP
jgi:hypothetical protein